MALTAVGLCSRALVKIGASAIADFHDGTAEAAVAAALYDTARDALLSAHPWNFALRQATLPQLEETPVADYAFAFQLPADFLRAVSAGPGGRGRGLDYQIRGRTLCSSAQTVALTYIARVDEADFPAFFNQALLARLSAEFCLPLTENAARSEVLQKLAESEFRRARIIDQQQDQPAGFEDFSLIEARGR